MPFQRSLSIIQPRTPTYILRMHPASILLASARERVHEAVHLGRTPPPLHDTGGDASADAARTEGETDSPSKRSERALELLDEARQVCEGVTARCAESGGDEEKALAEEAEKLLEDEIRPQLAGLRSFLEELSALQRFDTVLCIADASVYKIDMKARRKKRRKVFLFAGTLELLQPAPTASRGEEEEREEECEDAATLPITLMKLERFQFPLTKQIPCMRVSKGYYVFPTPQDGVFYGIVLPDGLPQVYSDLFDRVLSEHCSVHAKGGDLVEPAEEQAPAAAVVVQHVDGTEELSREASASTAVAVREPAGAIVELDAHAEQAVSVRAIKATASGIEKGAQYAVRGISYTARVVRDGVQAGGQYVASKVDAGDRKRDVRVPGAVRSTVRVAASVTPHVVWVSNAAIDLLSDFAVETGKVVGHAVAERYQASRGAKEDDFDPVTGEGRVMTEKEAQQRALSEARWKAVRGMGNSVLRAGVEVLDALEEAGGELVQAVGEGGEAIVEARYGAEAATVARDVTKVAKDTYSIGATAYSYGGKKGAKRMARRVAKKAALGGAKACITYEDNVAEVRYIADGGDAQAQQRQLIEGSVHRRMTESEGVVGEADVDEDVFFDAEEGSEEASSDDDSEEFFDAEHEQEVAALQ